MVDKWDKYFLEVANTIAFNSSCMSRAVGAILVRDKSIISTGYNGPPKGVRHCNEIHLDAFDGIIKEEKIDVCPRRLANYKSGEGLHLCPAAHAERNAIDFAAKNGTSTDGSSMYVNCGIPCSECLKSIINAGIVEVIVTSLDIYDSMTTLLLKESMLKVRKYSHLTTNIDYSIIH